MSAHDDANEVTREVTSAAAAPEMPPDLRAVAASLDALAAHDRSLGMGMEERVYQRTRSLLAGPALRLTEGETVHQGTGAGRGGLALVLTPLRLAAAVALMAGIGAAWLASLTSGVSTPMQMAARGVEDQGGRIDEMETRLVLAVLDEAWFGGTGFGGGELDALWLETDLIAESLMWDWPLNEGAM